jgi:type I restriction enzyme M protein
MAETKQERAELHKTIWKMAEDCRASVDGWDFKQYVLGMLFYRFISENLTKHLNEITREAKGGNPNFDYVKLSDKDAELGRTETIEEKGFFILPSELFYNVKKNASNNGNLNETLERVFNNIENSAKGYESENDLKGLFDDLDLSSKKLGATVNDRNKLLTKLLNSIANLEVGENYNDNAIDAFGDAYEFLMNMYAANAGKSGGQYFTPQEVGELLARIVSTDKTEINKVYDPCCGSGSLLLKFAKVLGKERVNKYCGQESNITSFNLCRINMFLHNINYNKFDIRHGDTLLDPKHTDEEPFDAIVSNPPYSQKWDGDINPILINDPRFSPAGVLAPKSNSDYAFTLHMLSWLSQKGTAAIVEFPGILYRGGAEQKIRKYLTENNFVDTIIQMPAGLFFGVGIATCIMVLKKNKKDNSVLFIDASDECIPNANRGKNDKKIKMLSAKNIENIVYLYKARTDKQYLSKLVAFEEIKTNDFELSVSKYVKKEDTAEVVDIVKLNIEITEITKRSDILRREIDEIIKEIENG